MKHVVVTWLLLCSSAFSQTIFSGSVGGVFTNPREGDVDGAGTNVIVFPGTVLNGELRFTPAASYTAGTEPFLLGRFDFQAVGTSVSGLTFNVTLGTQNADGSTGSVDFCLDMPIVQVGEPGFREIQLLFDPNETHTSAVNGTPYTFAYAGITPTEERADEVYNALGSIADVQAGSGYLWATVVQAPAGTPIDPDCGCIDCNQPPPGVPEPATAILAAFGALAWFARRWFTSARSQAACSSC